MKALKTLLPLFLIIALFFLGAVWYVRSGRTSKISTQNTSTQNQNVSRFSEAKKNINSDEYQKGYLPDKPGDSQVFYLDGKFDPPSFSVQRGSIVTFFNMDKTKILLLTGPNIPPDTSLGFGKNVGIGMIEKGVFKYSNKLDPKQQVTITVQ